MGLARPLLSEALTAPSVHGVSGLDGPALPEPDREAAPRERAGADGPPAARKRGAADHRGHGSP